ncbi:hypothetical protein O8I61_08300, partial [Campylobacter lari]|uniref:hypothetical protein n=1 Tax=Campylobacter lari TaxID=201 RepID=UPI003726A307
SMPNTTNLQNNIKTNYQTNPSQFQAPNTNIDPYQQGYQEGYHDGSKNTYDTYQKMFNLGYQQALRQGYRQGYQDGIKNSNKTAQTNFTPNYQQTPQVQIKNNLANPNINQQTTQQQPINRNRSQQTFANTPAPNQTEAITLN